VSVYADPFNKVLKGTKTDKIPEDFLRAKIFVGNGSACFGRDELFKTGAENEVDLRFEPFQEQCPQKSGVGHNVMLICTVTKKKSSTSC
jgi:hypothetical protein